MSWNVYCHSERNEWSVFDGDMNLIKPIYKFLLSRKEKNYPDNTMRANAYDLMEFYKFLGHHGLEIETIKPGHIEDFRSWALKPKNERDTNRMYLNKVGVTGATSWNRMLSSVISYIKWLELHDYDLLMSTVHLSNEKETKRQGDQNARGRDASILKIKPTEKVAKYITPEERREISSNLNHRDRLIFDFMYFSGMRIGELFSFEKTAFPPRPSEEAVFDIPLEHSTTPKIDRRTKTGARTLYIPNSLYQRLAQYVLFQRGRARHDILFTSIKNSGKSKKGSPLSPGTFRKNLSLACKKSGVKFTPHDLRHSFATDILRITGDIRIAQDILGHKSIDTTQKYVHPQDEDIVSTMGLVYQDLFHELLETI